MRKITKHCKIIPGESPAELEHLISDYQRVLQPIGPVEATLLRTAVRAEWMQRRYVRMESACKAGLTAAQGLAGNSLATAEALETNEVHALSKIARRYRAAGRQWHRAMGEMLRLQVQRQTTQSHGFSASSSR